MVVKWRNGLPDRTGYYWVRGTKGDAVSLQLIYVQESVTYGAPYRYAFGEEGQFPRDEDAAVWEHLGPVRFDPDPLKVSA